MNLNAFSQQILVMQDRLHDLYKGANASSKLQSDSIQKSESELLPVAFKELGIASEELQVAIEEIQYQNQELLSVRTEVEMQRQRYQDLFDFAPDGYLVTDVNGVIQEVNYSAAKLLNVTQRFLVGKPLIIFIDEKERKEFNFQLTKLQQAKQVQEQVLRLSPRHGEPFEAVVTVATISDQKGNVTELRLCIRKNTSGSELYISPAKSESNRDFDQDNSHQIYLKGEIVPLQSETIWQVSQGVIKLSTMTENGDEVLVGLAGPCMVFSADLTSLQTYQATALCEVKLACFSFKDILASPRLAQMILPLINQRLRQTEALLAISGQRRVQERFYKLLQLFKQEIGEPVEQGTRLSVRLTHQELADSCSTTRVTITRLLGKLQDQGRITIDSKNHIILTD